MQVRAAQHASDAGSQRHLQVRSLPEQFNWTSLASLSYVVNQASLSVDNEMSLPEMVLIQGGCGSCWAVTSAVVLSAHAEINGQRRSFSAQARSGARLDFIVSGNLNLAGACGLCAESEALWWQGRLFRGNGGVGHELCDLVAEEHLQDFDALSASFCVSSF